MKPSHTPLFLALVLVSSLLAGTIRLRTGEILKSGTIALEGSGFVRFKLFGTDSIVYIPSSQLLSIELAGIEYCYDAATDHWSPVENKAEEKTSGDTMPNKATKVLSPLTEHDPDSSETGNYTPLNGEQRAGIFSASLDSVFRNNFYAYSCSGTNIELTGEQVSLLNSRARLSYNAHSRPGKGVRNLIAGCCLLGAGIQFLVLGISEHDLTYSTPGIIIMPISGIQFIIRAIRKKEYEQWRELG